MIKDLHQVADLMQILFCFRIFKMILIISIETEKICNKIILKNIVWVMNIIRVSISKNILQLNRYLTALLLK
jgi:hypothetical protein